MRSLVGVLNKIKVLHVMGDEHRMHFVQQLRGQGALTLELSVQLVVDSHLFAIRVVIDCHSFRIMLH